MNSHDAYPEVRDHLKPSTTILRPAFLDTPYPSDKTAIDYIFVNQTNIEVLMKTKIIDFKFSTPEELPTTEKAFHRDDGSTVFMSLKPARLFLDPFRGGKNKIALCEVYNGNTPSKFNSRRRLSDFLNKINIFEEDPWIGFETEYCIINEKGVILGSNIEMKSFNSKVNYGPTATLERQIAEQHLKACLYAGLTVYGNVKETHCGQWEYQLGPTDCLRLADELIVSRYLLNRVAEMYGVKISFDPVHYADTAKTSFITSGLHLNYSTKQTRAENGIQLIHSFINRLTAVENDTIFPYYDRTRGKDTKQRLTGVTTFTSKDLNAKRYYFRIPASVQLKKCGYLEDRRPCADCDPYTAILGFLKSLYTDELYSGITNGVALH